MKNKFKVLSLVLLVCTVMCTQIFAKTFVPNGDVDIDIDRIEALEYTEDDIQICLDLYKYKNQSEEDLEKYDLDENGIIDTADVAMILNRI